MRHPVSRIIPLFLCFCFLLEQAGIAHAANELNIAGHLSSFRNSFISDTFRPLHLRYLSFNPIDNNFRLFLDKGSLKDPSDQEMQDALKTLMRYFLVGLALPNDSFWVNLRPDSPNQIIDDRLAQTDVGKVMLETDLQLKKDLAQATSPNTPDGKKYWDALYQKARALFGSEQITIPTITRPWIVPGEIIIRETSDSAYIYKATLKVMLEQDYLRSPQSIVYSPQYEFKDERLKILNEYSTQFIKELIIPKLTKAVNSSKRYAALRQIYYSLIMAQWFKVKYDKREDAPRNPISDRIDSGDLSDLASRQAWTKDTYFKAYQKSFKEGEYSVKEPVYTDSGQCIRSYVSGGQLLKIALPERGQPTTAGVTKILAADQMHPSKKSLVELTLDADLIFGSSPLYQGEATVREWADHNAGTVIVTADDNEQFEFRYSGPENVREFAATVRQEHRIDVYHKGERIGLAHFYLDMHNDEDNTISALMWSSFSRENSVRNWPVKEAIHVDQEYSDTYKGIGISLMGLLMHLTKLKGAQGVALVEVRNPGFFESLGFEHSDPYGDNMYFEFDEAWMREQKVSLPAVEIKRRVDSEGKGSSSPVSSDKKENPPKRTILEVIKKHAKAFLFIALVSIIPASYFLHYSYELVRDFYAAYQEQTFKNSSLRFLLSEKDADLLWKAEISGKEESTAIYKQFLLHKDFNARFIAFQMLMKRCEAHEVSRVLNEMLRTAEDKIERWHLITVISDLLGKEKAAEILMNIVKDETVSLEDRFVAAGSLVELFKIDPSLIDTGTCKILLSFIDKSFYFARALEEAVDKNSKVREELLVFFEEARSRFIEPSLIKPQDFNTVIFSLALRNLPYAEKAKSIIILYNFASQEQNRYKKTLYLLSLLRVISFSLSESENARLNEQYPEITVKLRSLENSQTLPYKEIFGPKNTHKEFNVRAFIPLGPEDFKRMFSRIGLIERGEGEKTIFSGALNGKKVNVHLDTSGDPKDYKVKIFQEIGDPDVHSVVYSGHTGMGGTLSPSLKEAPEIDEFQSGTKLIVVLSCWSDQVYSNEIKARYPYSQGIYTATGSRNASDVKALEAILQGVTREEAWPAIERKIEKATSQDEHKVSYLLPNKVSMGLRRNYYVPTSGVVFLEENDSFAFEPGNVAVEDIVSTKPAQVFQKAQYFFNWNTALKEISRSLQADGVRRPEDDNQDVFILTSVPAPGREGVWKVAINAGYRNSSKSALTMMLLYELNRYFSKNVLNKDKGMTVFDKLRGLQMAAEFVKTHHKESLWPDFLKKYGYTPEQAPLELLALTLDTNESETRIRAVNELLKKLGHSQAHGMEELNSRGLLSQPQHRGESGSIASSSLSYSVLERLKREMKDGPGASGSSPLNKRKVSSDPQNRIMTTSPLDSEAVSSAQAARLRDMLKEVARGQGRQLKDLGSAVEITDVLKTLENDEPARKELARQIAGVRQKELLHEELIKAYITSELYDSNEKLFLFISKEGEVLGRMEMTLTERRGYLQDLGVSEKLQAQGKGIGSFLMNLFFRELRHFEQEQPGRKLDADIKAEKDKNDPSRDSVNFYRQYLENLGIRGSDYDKLGIRITPTEGLGSLDLIKIPVSAVIERIDAQGVSVSSPAEKIEPSLDSALADELAVNYKTSSAVESEIPLKADEQEEVSAFIEDIDRWQQARITKDNNALKSLTKLMLDRIQEWHNGKGALHIIGNTLSYFVYAVEGQTLDVDVLNPAVVILFASDDSALFSEEVEELGKTLQQVKIVLSVHPMPVTVDPDEKVSGTIINVWKILVPASSTIKIDSSSSPAVSVVTPENSISDTQMDLIRQDSLRNYLIKNRGDVVRISLLPDALFEDSQYYTDHIYQRIGDLLFDFNITKGRIFVRNWKKGGIIETDSRNKFINGLLDNFIEKIAESVRKRLIYEPLLMKLLHNKNITKLLGFSSQEASILLQDSGGAFSQTGLIIKNFEMGNVLELRLDDLTLEEALGKILDLRFCFSEISKKYNFDELENAMKELIKNAFVHGNRMNLKLPIFIHFDKSTRQIEVYDLATEKKLPANISRSWTGVNEGLSSLGKYWEYDRAKIIEEKSGQEMTRATIRQRGNAYLSPALSEDAGYVSSPADNKEGSVLPALLPAAGSEVKNKVSSALENKTGGIDFRNLPIVTQAVTNLSAQMTRPEIAGLERLNLDEEWENIMQMVNAGIAPSAERIKEYLRASCLNGQEARCKDKVIECIAEIFRQEEENCDESNPMLKDILVVLESMGGSDSLKEIFLGKG